MDLALVSAAVIAFGVLVYIVLDGFDLGVGVLFALSPDAEARATMMNSIAPVWDGNETWLILGGAMLFAAFPLAYAVDGMAVRWSWHLAAAIAFLVIGASMLAVSALHILMRRGQAGRVASLIYLTPLFAVALEWLMFEVAPSALSIAGIAITCAGVGLAVWRPGAAPPAFSRGQRP